MQIDKAELKNIFASGLFWLVSIICAFYVIGLSFHPFMAKHLFTSVHYGFMGGIAAFISQWTSFAQKHTKAEEIEVSTFGIIFVILGVFGFLMLSFEHNDISTNSIYLSATTYWGALCGTLGAGIIYQKIFCK